MQHPSIDQLRQAVQIADQIQQLEAQLATILGGGGGPAPMAKRKPGRPRKQPVEAEATPAVRRKRGKLSAAGRANIIAAQKARWAKIKAKKG